MGEGKLQQPIAQSRQWPGVQSLGITCTYTDVHMHMHTCTCARTHTHVYMHSYTHTHTSQYMHGNGRAKLRAMSMRPNTGICRIPNGSPLPTKTHSRESDDLVAWGDRAQGSRDIQSLGSQQGSQDCQCPPKHPMYPMLSSLWLPLQGALQPGQQTGAGLCPGAQYAVE